MSQSAIVPARSRSIPYALPPDALEGLLRLAAHVALTESAVLFFQQEDSYWVLATSGVSAEAAHTASLLLPDVLENDANEFLCLDAAAGPEAASLMGAALTGRPGFLSLTRFAVEGPGCHAILGLAHSVARPHVSEETGILLSELARQIALRMEARAEKRELEASRERRSQRDRFLSALCNERTIGQCLVDSNGLISSLSSGLVNSFQLGPEQAIGKRFEHVFALESAFRDDPNVSDAAVPSGDTNIPWGRGVDIACFHRSEDGGLVRLSATATGLRLPGRGEAAWCVLIARADEESLSSLNASKRNQKVLIAEDHPVNQRVIQGMVEKLGLSADIVSNGLEAVHAVCHEHYAAVLMDCQMPDMDGIEATRFIRSNEDRIGRVPIVAVTAFGHEDDRIRCFEAGVDEFMVKPIRIEVLAKVLARWAPIAPENDVVPSPSYVPEPDTSTRQDIERALERLSADLDPELVREVVALFLEDTKVRIEEIRRLSANQERVPLRDAAHKIKGSCGSLGARSLMAECELLEELAKSGTREQMEASTERVAKHFHTVIPILREFLERPA